MPDRVLDFWFTEIEPRQWWQVDPAFDTLIGSRFGALLDQAIAGELHAWRSDPRGRLAEIIVLDQFSRNIHRGTPLAFAQDAQALTLSQVAVQAGALDQLSEVERGFLLMPFMHSESRDIHAQAETLFKTHASANTFEFERKHKAIVDRFGRYPHRNAILGRNSTDEEIEFLKRPGSGF